MTYEQLIEQETEILDKIQTQEHKLELMVQLEKRQKMQTDDDLDQFMSNLSNMDQKVDKFAISSTKMEISHLKTEHQKIQKLINIAKPSISLPPVTATKGKLPLFGKRNVLGRNFGFKKSESPVVATNTDMATTTDTTETVNEAVEVEKNVLSAELDRSEPSSVAEVTKASPEKKSLEGSPILEKVKLKPDLEEPAEKKMKIEKSKSDPSAVEPSSTSSQEPSAKKRKSRIRLRNRLRENIDMNDDDEYIDEEKVSTWVAPEDQTGDGTTHLNQKYGY